MITILIYLIAALLIVFAVTPIANDMFSSKLFKGYFKGFALVCAILLILWEINVIQNKL